MKSNRFFVSCAFQSKQVLCVMLTFTGGERDIPGLHAYFEYIMVGNHPRARRFMLRAIAENARKSDVCAKLHKKQVDQLVKIFKHMVRARAATLFGT